LTTLDTSAAAPVQLVVNGQTRSYLLERPTASGPRPTIIMLHGAGAGAARELELSHLDRAAPKEGFVGVFPEGRGGRWNFAPPGKESPRDVSLFQQYGGLPDDVAFIRALVGDLVRRNISDPKRIFIAGRSLGGVMALRMVCVDAETFAALGLLIAAMPDVTGADCHPAKPLPAVLLNGTADQILPYGGGQSRSGDSLWPTERLVAFLRRLDGCAGPPEREVRADQPLHPIEIERSAQCTQAPVVFYRVLGGEHEVPARIHAAALLLDFFRDKSRETPSATTVAHPATSARCTRFETRLFADLCNGCTKPPFNEELTRTADNEWTIDYIDGTKTHRTYKYRLISESDSEILLYDASRDIHARLDLKARKGFGKRGSGADWKPLLDITKAECR